MTLMHHVYAMLIAIGQVGFVMAFLKPINGSWKFGKAWYIFVILTIFLYFNDLTIFAK